MSAGTRGAGGGGPVRAVTGGTVVTPDGEVRADVLIGDGRITALVPPGEASGPGAGRTVDAAGCYVLPGGVDPHCHLMPDIPRATAAAARGGTKIGRASCRERVYSGV